MIKKSNRRSKGISLYANLSAHRRSKADAKSRRRAEYLATLPKHPVKRLMYRLHPKRVFKFWFSREGGLTILKLAGVGIVIMVIFVAALFAYYRRELDAFSPSELAKRVSTTVTKYYDRNDVLLWEDKGDQAYTLVIESKDIPKVFKDATVAIEDKDYYKHGGISITGIIRAAINNAGGGEIQGGSTLTQQLIKLVFFAEDAQQNRLNISRKIEEAILAIEVERMYNKDQIITLYNNEAPYGGRRNGVESAALTYFGKHAKDLTLPEAALIAAIPKDPSLYNPYNVDGNKALIARQHTVLNNMAEQGYVTKQQAEEAKKVPILDTLKDEFADSGEMKAPHFVQEVRSQLEKELTPKVVREGGLTVKTTLDYRVQQFAEETVQKNRKNIFANGADNTAVTAIDVPTGQVLAMVGSYDYSDKSYGATNAAVSYLSPGSSIKPFMYANLFKPRSGANFGAGTILADENVDKIYDPSGKAKLNNFDNKFYGSMTIREALGNSRNTPVVKAAYITGIESGVQTARDAGDLSYCTREDYGLSAAIGSCGLKQVEHVNAFATFGRQGVYKPIAYTLEVKNSQGQTLKQWKDQPKRVLDPQISFLISDILTDPKARSRVFGSNPAGFAPPGVKTATKTGTTDDGNKHAKDNWMMSYSPRMAVGIWVGNHTGKHVNYSSTIAHGSIMNDIMTKAHKDVFQKDGSWKPNDWFTKPAGIQTLTVNGKTDLFPSWFVKPSSSGEKITFDKVSKKKATNCTPARAKVEMTVQTYEDPVTKKKTSSADGYDVNADDDVHKCDDVKPFVTLNAAQVGGPSSRKYHITATVNQGTHPLSSIEISVDGQTILNQSASSSGSSFEIDHEFTTSGTKNISATLIDQMMYDGTATTTKTVSDAGNGRRSPIARRPLTD